MTSAQENGHGDFGRTRRWSWEVRLIWTLTLGLCQRKSEKSTSNPSFTYQLPSYPDLMNYINLKHGNSWWKQEHYLGLQAGTPVGVTLFLHEGFTMYQVPTRQHIPAGETHSQPIWEIRCLISAHNLLRKGRKKYRNYKIKSWFCSVWFIAPQHTQIENVIFE